MMLLAAHLLVSPAVNVITSFRGVKSEPMYSVVLYIGSDFTPLNEVITFTAGETRRCAANNITILTDNIVESLEFFTIRISSNDVPINSLSSFGTSVNIGDRSRKLTCILATTT